MMLAGPDGAKSEPSMVHDEALNIWGAAVPLKLEVKGESGPVTLPIQLTLIGMAMV